MRLFTMLGGAAMLLAVTPARAARAQATQVVRPGQQDRKWGAYADAGSHSVEASHANGVSISDGAYGTSASASAQFFDGTVHASVFTNPEGGARCGWWEVDCTWGMGATAIIWDEITVKPSAIGGPVTWSFSIDGTGNRGPRRNNGWWSAESDFYFGSDKTMPVDVIKLSTGTVSFAGSYDLGDEPVTFYMYMRLSAIAHNGAWADYGNTMRFAWGLPPGATYTSASGALVAPTVAATTAPEPATWLLLAAGLAGLGAHPRRRAAFA